MSSWKRLDASTDFVECLCADISVRIFDFLDDPSDLIRATAVSTSWRRFVVVNGLCKHLCVKMFPEVSGVVGIEALVELGLESEHKVYATLARGLSSSVRNDCLAVAFSASSTDHYPFESIRKTLEPGDKDDEDDESYWSSVGESDATVPERLTYFLKSKLCLITEIHVQPNQAFSQDGHPIFSARSVRFLMGHFARYKELGANESTSAQQSTQEKYVWTYASPEFSMAQENRLQKFVLPVPVLCLGGVLQVELLGRVQKQASDGLYYVCISHVQAVGRPLSSAFDVELSDPSGKWTMRHHGDDADVRGWELMLHRCVAAQQRHELRAERDEDEDLYEEEDAFDYEEEV